MELEESSTEMTGVLTMSRLTNVEEISPTHGTSLRYAAEISVNASSVEETAQTTTLKLAKSRESTTGVSGVPMMRIHAHQTTTVFVTQRDLQTSVYAASITLSNDYHRY